MSRSPNSVRKRQKLKNRYKKEEKAEQKGDDKKTPEQKNNMLRMERKYYFTADELLRLQTDEKLIASIRKEFLGMGATFAFEKGEGIVRGGHLDAERVLRILEENCGFVFTQAEFERFVNDLVSIDRDRGEMKSDPSKTISDFLTTTGRGTRMTKHLCKGAPRSAWIAIVQDRLYWKDNEKSSNHTNRSLEMKSISDISPGIKDEEICDKLKKLKPKVKSEHCFTIKSVTKNPIVLECPSIAYRDEWFNYLTFVHRHFVPARRRTMFLEDADNPLDDDVMDLD